MNMHIGEPGTEEQPDKQPAPRRRKLDAHRQARTVPSPRLQSRRDDQAFLPADLEILETPPSPVRMALIPLICAFVVIALAWSWLGHIEIIAAAQGKIQPMGRVKVIQPLETGKVTDIHVRNGQSVKAGDVVLELDRGEAEADDTAASAALASSRAEAIRRRKALDVATEEAFQPTPAITWDTEIPATVRAREDHVLQSDLGQLTSSIASLDAQIHQKQVECDRLDETMRSEEALLSTLKERVDIRTAVVTSGGGSRASVIDSLETMQTQQTQLSMQRSQRDTAIANMEV
jgi:hemolysin D